MLVLELPTKRREWNCQSFVIVIFLIYILQSALGSISPTCLDENGNIVDWFIVYKLPILQSSPNKLIKSGLGQAYIDSTSQVWQISQQPINGTGHAVYNTLQQIYSNGKSEEMFYMFYNDESPTHVSNQHGHTKGDIAFDKRTGFWLMHSVPRFPPVVNDTYGYPSTAVRFGQIFLCVSFDYPVLDVIGKQFLFNRPQVYEKNFPPSFKDNLNIAKVINGTYIKDAPFNNSVVIKSLKGQPFVSFAKCAKFGQDIYHDWVAGYFQSRLFVESWLHGTGNLPSNCSNPQVYNVRELNFTASFKSTKDHSKWCVSVTNSDVTDLNKADNWVCIGDLNRQEKQTKRGGGTLCLQQKSVWNAFYSLVLKTENCSTL